ncbi:MAG: hypothetical protein ACO3FA_03105 [Vulcanococcus sp.]
MPSFDSGYYAFTALIPLLPAETDRRIWGWTNRPTSLVHSLRELLGSLPTVDVPDAGDGPAGGVRPIPFSGCARTHFARLVVVEELAWNGREGCDTLIELLKGALGWPDRQPIDRLPRPYLLVMLDFDATDGGSASVENYLNGLWSSLEQEWTLILRHCSGFDLAPQRRRQSYVELLLRHEIDSTFTYTGYGWAAQQAGLWDPETGRFRQPAAASPPPGLQLLILWSGLVLCLLLGPLLVWLVNQGAQALAWLLHPLQPMLDHLLLPGSQLWLRWTPLPLPILWRWLLLLGGLLLLLPLLWNGFYGSAFHPWPAEPGTDLRSVLKALYLQGRFLELTEQRQHQQASGTPSFRRQFRAFLEETQPNDRDAPTLRPGSIEAIRRNPRP